MPEVTFAPVYIEQRRTDDWYEFCSPNTPPPDQREVAEVREIPHLPGEHSRTTVRTQAGITMTVIVGWPLENGVDELWRHGSVRYRVVCQDVSPALHLEHVVDLNTAAEYHGAVVNELVRQVQHAVLQRCQQTTITETGNRIANLFRIPDSQFGITTGASNYTINTQYTLTVPYYSNLSYADSVFLSGGMYGPPTTIPLTPEGEAAVKAKLAEHDKQAKEANQRAEQLLLDLLGKMGLAHYKRKGYVLIMSRTKPGIVYHVKGMAGIDLYERKNGKIISLKQYMCIHPQETYPEADTVAAQVLLCRHDEDTLWKTANIHKRAQAGRELPAPMFINNYAA